MFGISPWTMSRLVLLLLLPVVMATAGVPDGVDAETGAYLIKSPFSSTKMVTSPTKFHNGCAYTSYYDHPGFDDGSCGSAASPTAGDWSMDLEGAQSNYVYIDICPGSIDGQSAGGEYRVIAGTVGNWSGSGNTQYQYFGIHAKDGSGNWINYAWILFGHIDTLQYSEGSTVVAATTSCATVYVARIAAAGTWPAHLHMEGYNYSNYSRTYDWDGPSNAADLYLTPTCSRSQSNSSDCNAQVTSVDTIGYVGGTQGSYTELNNPYYPDF